MNAIRDLHELRLVLPDPEWAALQQREKRIYAFLLYTDEDNNISSYVKRYFIEIDRLLGTAYLLFVLEKPPKKWLEEAREREYWKEYEKIAKKTDAKELNPYDKSKAYEIAKFLELPETNIPCIVFFNDLEDKQLLVYRLDNSWPDTKITQELRELFSYRSKHEKKLLHGKVNPNEVPFNVMSSTHWRNLEELIQKKNRERKLSEIAAHPLTRTVGSIFKEIVIKFI